MTHQSINLYAIDFSNPEGEFTFRGQSYQIKRYLDRYFFKQNTQKALKYIYAFENSYQADQLCKQQKTLQAVEEIIQHMGHIGEISRCVEYKDTIFCFTDYGGGQYYSLKNESWELFCWKAPKNMHLNYLLEMPYDFFINQAKIVEQKEIPLIESDSSFYSYKKKTENEPTEFICGSYSELKRLTKIASFTLHEFVSLLEKCSNLTICYFSENDYSYGGFAEIKMSGNPHSSYNTISQQARKLLDIIFEYNLFIGLDWEYTDGIPDYTGYIPQSRIIEIEVEAPSQHERLEALLELKSWLKGKLPEEEIKPYFEENYMLDLSNFMEVSNQEIDEDMPEF